MKPSAGLECKAFLSVFSVVNPQTRLIWSAPLPQELSKTPKTRKPWAGKKEKENVAQWSYFKISMEKKGL